MVGGGARTSWEQSRGFGLLVSLSRAEVPHSMRTRWEPVRTEYTGAASRGGTSGESNHGLPCALVGCREWEGGNTESPRVATETWKGSMHLSGCGCLCVCVCVCVWVWVSLSVIVSWGNEELVTYGRT
jgi:hypothetical protein